jgi:hypothetical protein
MKDKTKNTTEVLPMPSLESEKNSELSHDEIEVRLAIADYIIRRACGTATGQEIFDALIRRFEGRYPHHKLLSYYLITSEYLNNESKDEDI